MTLLLFFRPHHSSSSPPAVSLMGEGVRYVSESGSDGFDGLSEYKPKRSVQAAYDSLPMPASDIAAVQKIVVAPGEYYAGSSPVLAMVCGKPAWIAPTVRVPPYVTSTLTAPLDGVRCARFRTDGLAHVTMIGGSASAKMLGCCFEDVLFEFKAAATKIGIDANSAWYGEVNRCYGFADKTSVPAAVDAQLIYVRDDTTYGGAGTDDSWWRVDNNKVINMALGTFGDAGGNNNHHVFTRNHGFGLNHTNTSAKPFLTIINGNRCSVRDTNIEAYHVGIRLDSCWECQESGTGGEFVDVLLDLYNTKGCNLTPAGTSMYALGSTTPIIPNPLLVRGDAYSKANIITLASTWFSGNDQRLWQPVNDATQPSISMASSDNIVVSWATP